MRKTSVYLSEEETARLSVLAAREGVPQAEVIRRAIRHYEPQAARDRNFALAGSSEGPGGSVADIPEDELLQGFGT
ncbi:MAG TPA: CopG family transcriptional regulator [Streptosporangiaceae bacterium]|nr:CopG family transcriptional regulator [Streptosporangiaceae bacterium]